MYKIYFCIHNEENVQSQDLIAINLILEVKSQMTG